MFGCQAKLPIDLMYDLPNADTTEKPATEYAAQLKKTLSDA